MLSESVDSIFGNKCWHNPQNLRNISFSAESKRPKVIQWAMQRIRKFFIASEKFDELRSLNKPRKNQELRKLRSEGRESLMNISLMLFYNLELSTMTVRLDDRQLAIPTIERLTNNGKDLSVSRAYRALKKLKEAGYINVTRQFEHSDNLYKALASIKEVNYKFFHALGLGKNYGFSQGYKRKIIEKRAVKSQRRNSVQDLFDKFLPDRDFKYDKISKKGKTTYQVVTSKDIQEMRLELIQMTIAKSPTVDPDMIKSVIGKYSYEQLKRSLENQKKSQAP